MKTPLIFAAAAMLAAAGCDQQKQQARTDGALNSDKSAVEKTVRDAKAEVDKQAKAQKEMLDAEAKSAQAKIDAEKARAKAESTDAQAKVDAASQNIREAAGSASAKAQTEIGAAKNSTVETAPPAESITPTATRSTTPAPTTPATAATELDQQLTEKVRTAVLGAASANTDESKAIQIAVSGGTVTLTGSVKSDAEKSRAESTARAVPGVNKVDNQLRVKTE